MRFAFPAQLVPDPAQAPARARELSYDAFEIATDPSDPSALEALSARWRSSDIPVACLATALSMPARSRDRRAVADALRRATDVAADLGCRLVRILGPRVARGTSPAVAAVEMGHWLVPTADHAARRGVTIVIANAHSFATARPLWTLLETINHPNVAASWDLLTGFVAGQSPHVSVPTLNTRIRYARIADAAAVAGMLQARNLGEGEAPVRDFLDRLRGVGYTGYLTYAPATADDLGPALVKLKDWTKPQIPDKPARRPVPASR
jgi:sugar phosphate isomerase/epimerase